MSLCRVERELGSSACGGRHRCGGTRSLHARYDGCHSRAIQAILTAPVVYVPGSEEGVCDRGFNQCGRLLIKTRVASSLVLLRVALEGHCAFHCGREGGGRSEVRGRARSLRARGAERPCCAEVPPFRPLLVSSLFSAHAWRWSERACTAALAARKAGFRSGAVHKRLYTSKRASVSPTSTQALISYREPRPVLPRVVLRLPLTDSSSGPRSPLHHRTELVIMHQTRYPSAPCRCWDAHQA